MASDTHILSATGQEWRRWWEDTIGSILRALLTEAGSAADRLGAVVVEQPSRREYGDLAFPMFAAAPLLHRPPAHIASEVADRLAGASAQEIARDDRNARPTADYGSATAVGPYVNVSFNRARFLRQLLAELSAAGDTYGRGDHFAGQRVMIEFSSPNTNKPLHLGHLRNNIIGESLARILAAGGAEVCRVNLINDRGIHICKSMCAYRRFADGATPQSTGKKPDHFVGDYYVRFHKWATEDPQAEQEARAMLAAWEAGDPDVRDLWQKMNGWAIAGMQQTYRDTGIEFDRIDWESELYLEGKQTVMRGLHDGIFYRSEDGSIWVDLKEIGLDHKVLLRSDGTALYLTQDIGAAIRRQREWQFDRLIYVVASEQRYHFQVLFHVLHKLGYGWATELYHRSYGMVTLPDGNMKSREGSVVDADDLLETLRSLVRAEIKQRERERTIADIPQTAHKIAIAALHYYLLQVDPDRDMNFLPSRSIGMRGDTGPYLQYVGARIVSLLRQDPAIQNDDIDSALLQNDAEWDIALLLADWPAIVARAGERLDPTQITSFLRDLGTAFSRYYHDYPLAVEPDPALRAARLALARATLQVLRNALQMVAIPFIEQM